MGLLSVFLLAKSQWLPVIFREATEKTKRKMTNVQNFF
jgi:hypothetical protein